MSVLMEIRVLAVLHITLTSCQNESRLLKQCDSLAKQDAVTHVAIAALWEPGLRRGEVLTCGVVLRRFRLLSRSWGSALIVQIFKYIEFSFRVLSMAFGMRVSVVCIHSLALLPLGVLIKLICKCRLIYDAHELETERVGLHGIRKRLSRLIEKAFIRWCDHTFVVSESIRDHYVSSYGAIKVSTVMNCPRAQVAPQESYIFHDTFGLDPDSVIFLYQGMLDEGRGLDRVLDAFNILSCDPQARNLHLVIMGYGPLFEKIATASAQVENVHLHPAVAPDRVLNYTASAHIGLSLIDPISLSYEYSLPNKVFEYRACGLRILASDLTELRRHSVALGITLVPQCSSVDLAKVFVRVSREAPDSDVSLLPQYTWEWQEAIMLSAYEKLIFRAK